MVGGGGVPLCNSYMEVEINDFQNSFAKSLLRWESPAGWRVHMSKPKRSYCRTCKTLIQTPLTNYFGNLEGALEGISMTDEPLCILKHKCLKKCWELQSSVKLDPMDHFTLLFPCQPSLAVSLAVHLKQHVDTENEFISDWKPSLRNKIKER